MTSGRPSARSLLGLLLLVAAVSAASQWWQARGQREIGADIAAIARPGDIRLVSSETCPYCVQARRWLEQHRVPFEECFVERDAACRATYDALLRPGTPVVIVGGRAQLGFDPERVRQSLRQAPAIGSAPLTPARG